MEKLLTKSNYLAGLQCKKLLWIKTHNKERLTPPSEVQQNRFKKGYSVENIAKENFKAVPILGEGFAECLEQSKAAISNKVGVFEASFLAGRLYSRADLLLPVSGEEGNVWDLYEIKSATRVKEQNLHDVSFQKYVYEKAGLTIRDCFIVHINNEYVFDGLSINSSELFKTVNVTAEVAKISEGIERRVQEMLEVIDEAEPRVDIGPYCNAPYECDMKHECWKHVMGVERSVFDMYYGQDRPFEFYNKGIVAMKDIPDSEMLSSKQIIQKNIGEEPYVEKEKLRKFLNLLEYPLYCLDFETVNPAVPKFTGMRPYQRIPFQYSLHVIESPGAAPRHISFLHKNRDDPRSSFLSSLKEHLGEKGSIVIYNRAFEESVLTESVKANPAYNEWLSKVKERLVDLIIPFRNFDYYNSKQKGSTSIKNVVKAFKEDAYTDLSIASGDVANFKYEEAVYNEDMGEEEKQQIFEDLEKYCAEDTLAEVYIIEGLRRVVESSN